MSTTKPRFEIATVTLTPVSPIHISAGESDYGAADLVVDNSIVLIDERELGEVLKETGLLLKYVEFVEDSVKRGEKKNVIKAFFNQSEVKKKITFEEVIKRICPDNALKYKKVNKDEFIRGADDKPFIPGSSLKGAIRTAILFQLLQIHLNESAIDYLNTDYLHKKFFDKNGNQRKPDRKKLDDELIQLSFEDFYIKDKKTNQSLANQGSLTDFMRAVSVSDSTPIALNMKNLEVHAVSLDRSHSVQMSARAGKHELFFDFEHPAEQPNVTFTITIDHEILAYFDKKSSVKGFKIPFDSITNLKECLKSYSKAMWHEERLFFYGYPVEPFDPKKEAEKELLTKLEDIQKVIAQGQKEVFQEWLFNATEFNIGLEKANEVYEQVSKQPENLKDTLVSLLTKKYEKMKQPDSIPAIIQGNNELVANIIDFYKQERRANIRLGYGSGLLGITLFPMINEDYRKKIRNLLKDLGDAVAPNSRRLVLENDTPVYPLGWARLEFSPSVNEFGEPWP